MPVNLDLTAKESKFLEIILTCYIAEHQGDSGSEIYYAKTILGHMYHLKELQKSKEIKNNED